MANATTIKQGRHPVNIRLILSGSTLVAAVVTGLFIASYPQAVNILFIALATTVVLFIVTQWPEWGLLLSVFLFAVQKSPELPVFGTLLTVSEIILVLASLGWLAQNARQRDKVGLCAPGLLGSFFFYALVAVLSLVNAFVFADLALGVAELLARIYLMFFLVIVACYATSTSRYHRVLLAWVASTALVVGLIPLVKIGFEPVPLTSGTKFVALFRKPNALSGYLTGTFLAFLPFALSRRPLTAFPHVGTLARFSLPGLLWALVLTGSQAAYLGVAAGIAAWPFIRLSKRLGPILVLLALLVSVLTPFAVLASEKDADTFPNRVLSSIGFEQSRIPGRIVLVETRFRTIADHPVTGVGLGQAGKYTYYKMVAGKEEDVVSHFTSLGIVTETGLLGFLAISVVLITLLRIMRENAALTLDRDSGWLQLNEGLIIAFIGILIFGLTHDVQTNRTMWLVLSLIVSFKSAFLSFASHYSTRSQPDIVL